MIIIIIIINNSIYCFIPRTVTHENKVAGYYDVSPKRTQATVFDLFLCAHPVAAVYQPILEQHFVLGIE